MTDLVTIDRVAILDLIVAITELTKLVADQNKPKTIEDLEQKKLKLRYIDKLVCTSMESYKKHNEK